MSKACVESESGLNLRVVAETRLREGNAPPSNGVPTDAGALTLLHKLASSPASADDALKLLHELQVHQVELDMQQEQLESTRRELAEDLARYQGLYQYLPAGYLKVDSGGDIIEGNLAGAEIFCTRQDELAGRQITSFLAPDSRPILRTLLQEVRLSGSRASCEVTSGGEAAGSRQWRIMARSAPGASSYLIVIMELDPPQAVGPENSCSLGQVIVMKPSDSWKFGNSCAWRWTHGPGIWRVSLKRPMRAPLMVIIHIGFE